MKCSSSFARRGAAVVVLAGLMSAALAGCSLFGGTPANQTSTIPAVTDAQTPTDGSASATTSSALPSVSASVKAPVAPTVPGYTFAQAAPSVTRQFQTVTSANREVFAGLTTRSVLKGSQQVGTIVLLGLQTQLVGNKQVEGRLVPGMIKGMSGEGAKAATQKIGGQDVAVATTKTTNVVGWYHGGIVVLMLANGADTAPSLAFVKAFLAAR